MQIVQLLVRVQHTLRLEPQEACEEGLRRLEPLCTHKAYQLARQLASDRVSLDSCISWQHKSR